MNRTTIAMFYEIEKPACSAQIPLQNALLFLIFAASYSSLLQWRLSK